MSPEDEKLLIEEYEKAFQAVKERWPQVAWRDFIEDDTLHFCISADIGGVRVYMEARRRKPGEIRWDAQVEGAETDWIWGDRTDPVKSMEIALNRVKEIGLIWEKLSTGL